MIAFEKMLLSEDQNTVKIIANCFEHRVVVELSILQLAKIFGTDKDVFETMETSFGSTKYEERCDETRRYVQRFPEINIENNTVEFRYVSVTDQEYRAENMQYQAQEASNHPETISVYAEDIVGWDNEGIRIRMPRKIYENELKGTRFGVLVRPFSIDLKTK